MSYSPITKEFNLDKNSKRSIVQKKKQVIDIKYTTPHCPNQNDTEKKSGC